MSARHTPFPGTDRLDAIVTDWSAVAAAHSDAPDATAARALLLSTYSGPVFRYLLGAVRDTDVASELTQEFALRFMRGDFSRATPVKGDFRNYVKSSLFRLVSDYYRRLADRPTTLPEDDIMAPTPADDEFSAAWRAAILSRTWDALATADTTYHAALRLRADHPDYSSTDLAAHLSARLHRPIAAPAVRQMIHRARASFAQLLIDDVLAYLDSPANLIDELADLGLLRYCQDAVTARGAF